MTQREVYKVSELLQEINHGFAARYFNVAVEGEVTNLNRSTAGHIYFTIKDRYAQLDVALFATEARRVKFKLENGLQLIVRGRLEIYEQRGRFQMKAVAVEPAGIGALQLAFEQMKAKLAAEGLFDPRRKKPIPMLPRHIAIVTSPQGAAIRDILNVLGRRFAGLSIQIYPVRVQGATAAREIAAAVRNLSRWDLHDVLLICRGGGSMEDLWPFNEEVVARAIDACPIPVISGVGHEVDFTICDFVADLRAATPSAAAEIVVQAKADICVRVDHAVSRIRRVVESRVGRLRSDLRHLSSTDGLGRFPSRVRRLRERLQQRRLTLYQRLEAQARTLRRRLALATEPLNRFPGRLAVRDRQKFLKLMEERVATIMATRLARERQHLRAEVGRLEAVSPLSVLSRGYAIAFTRRGGRRRPLHDSMAVSVGERIEVQLKKGRLECSVDAKTLGLETLWPEIR